MAFLFTVVFIDALGFGLVLPLLPAYLPGFSLPGLAAGGAVSLFSLAQFGGLPALGALSDRLGRRPVLLAGLLGTALAWALLAFARSPLVVFAAIAFGGLASGTVSTAQAAATDLADVARHARRLGMLGVGYGAGITLGPLIAAVASRTGPHAAPSVAAALALANAVAGSIAFRETLPPASRARGSPRAVDLLPIAALVRALSRPGLRAPYVAVLLVNASLMAVIGTAAVFTAERFGWGGRENGLLFAGLAATGAAAQAGLLPLLERRFTWRRYLPASLAVAALAVAAAPFVRPGWLLPVALVPFAAGLGVAIPGLAVRVARVAGEDTAGKALAGMNAVVSIAFIGAPLAAGSLAGISGAAPWFFAAAMAAAAGAFMLGARTAVAR